MKIFIAETIPCQQFYPGLFYGGFPFCVKLRMEFIEILSFDISTLFKRKALQ